MSLILRIRVRNKQQCTQRIYEMVKQVVLLEQVQWLFQFNFPKFTSHPHPQEYRNTRAAKYSLAVTIRSLPKIKVRGYHLAQNGLRAKT